MPPIWKSGAAPSRPKTAHQSIRGRISGPIPIPNLVDNEFGAGNRESVLQQQQQPQQSRDLIEQQPPLAGPPATSASAPASTPASVSAPELHADIPHPTTTTTTTTTNNDGDSKCVINTCTPEQPSHPPPPPPSTAPPPSAPVASSPPRDSPPRNPQARNPPGPARRTNALSTLRYSTVSETPTRQTDQSKDGQPQRKKSTLRSALGRLFGRKKKSGGSQGSSTMTAVSERMSGMLSSAQHRSEPLAINRAKDNESKRSASLPITEFDRALRSHSIGPDDMTAVESVRESFQADTEPRKRSVADRRFVHPRRDTEWFGLSPRPASSHGRISRIMDDNPGTGEDPTEIGRAITSDSGGGTRRRSRSLSNLDDIAGVWVGTRRRSDEIRYWRESYDPGFLSPVSSNAQGTDGDNDAGMGASSLPGSPIAPEHTPKTPPQPFNFGNITNEMAGMKITHAASLDSRIGGLELRVHDLERTLDRVCHAVPGVRSHRFESYGRGGSLSRGGVTSDPSTFVFTSAVPPAIPAQYQNPDYDPATANSSRPGSSRPSVDADSHSHLSFGDAPTFIGSLRPPSSAATQPRPLTATAPPPTDDSDRPISTSTVRGVASLPTMGRDAAATSENAGDYAVLAAQLEAERAARRTLEAQVKKLSDRLNGLSTTMYAMVRVPAKSKSQEHLQLPVSPTAPAKSPPQQKQLRTAASKQPLRALSVFETDDDSDADKGLQPPGDTDEEYPSDGFQTPQEERPRYGAFGEELRDDDDDDDGEEGSDSDPKRRRAARTLSLSQLTVGKGRSVQI